VQFSVTANSNPYTITTDLNSFTLATTAETFCRQKAAELGITTAEDLILGCIPNMKNHLRSQLSQVDPADIPEGELSSEINNWLNKYREQQAAAVAQRDAAARSATPQASQHQTAFQIVIRIDDKDYTAQFDIRQSSPMLVAEELCTREAAALGIKTLDALVNLCLPRVSEHIRNEVNNIIAPNTIAVGEYSPQMKDIIRRENAARAAQ
jgi:hypothetical protein